MKTMSSILQKFKGVRRLREHQPPHVLRQDEFRAVLRRPDGHLVHELAAALGLGLAGGRHRALCFGAGPSGR